MGASGAGGVSPCSQSPAPSCGCCAAEGLEGARGQGQGQGQGLTLALVLAVMSPPGGDPSAGKGAASREVLQDATWRVPLLPPHGPCAVATPRSLQGLAASSPPPGASPRSRLRLPTALVASWRGQHTPGGGEGLGTPGAE